MNELEKAYFEPASCYGWMFKRIQVEVGEAGIWIGRRAAFPTEVLQWEVILNLGKIRKKGVLKIGLSKKFMRRLQRTHMKTVRKAPTVL